MSENEKDDSALYGFGGQMDEILADPEMRNLLGMPRESSSANSRPFISRKQTEEEGTFSPGADPRIQREKGGILSAMENVVPMGFIEDPEEEKLVRSFLMDIQNTEGELNEATNLARYGIRLAIEFGQKYHGFEVGQEVAYVNEERTYVLKAFDGENAMIANEYDGPREVPLAEIFNPKLAFVFAKWASMRIKIGRVKQRAIEKMIGGAVEENQVPTENGFKEFLAIFSTIRQEHKEACEREEAPETTDGEWRENMKHGGRSAAWRHFVFETASKKGWGASVIMRKMKGDDSGRDDPESREMKEIGLLDARPAGSHSGTRGVVALEFKTGESDELYYPRTIGELIQSLQKKGIPVPEEFQRVIQVAHRSIAAVDPSLHKALYEEESEKDRRKAA